MRLVFSLVAVAWLVCAVPAQQLAPSPLWQAVEQTLGRAAAPQPGGVMTFRFPRTDLSVMVGDVPIRPALALGGWAAFLPTATGAIAMGDLVLTTAEVAPVERALEAGGAEVMAIHNHLIGETPRLVYLHFMARGDPAAIATMLRAALALSGTPLVAPPAAPAAPMSLDTAAIARALGAPGKVNGGVYQTNVARTEPIVSDGVTLPPAMGLATVINIQPLDSGRAAAAGDFVLTEGQVTPVIRALLAHGISVTAVHSHLMSSTPTLRFVHFWRVGSPAALAEGIAAALAIQRK